MEDRADHDSSVAIIGLACRFPGGDEPAGFHDFTAAGRRMFRPAAGSPGEGQHAALLNAWGGHAVYGDPAGPDAGAVQKLAAETTALALADTGLQAGDLGAGTHGRAGLFLASSVPGIGDLVRDQSGFPVGPALPSAVTTSSLHAVAAAAEALSTGHLDLAIAGGAELGLDPAWLNAQTRAGILGRDAMRVYAADPCGLLPGEGCGVLILARSADARAAGMPIYAEIAGWSTVPVSPAGLDGQAVLRAYVQAGVDPADIQLIEGEGTGTAAGDLAELIAFAQLRQGSRGPAALGAVSACIGHLRAAAGIASLIKTSLAMTVGTIPAGTRCARPHELIQSGDALLRMPQEPEPWPDGSAESPGRRLAAVNSLGTMDPATGAGPEGLWADEGVHLVLSREAEVERSRGRRRRAAAEPLVPEPPVVTAVVPMLPAPPMPGGVPVTLTMPRRPMDQTAGEVTRPQPAITGAEMPAAGWTAAWEPAEAGVDDVGPGRALTDPVIAQTEPGVASTGPGVTSTGPGAAQAEPNAEFAMLADKIRAWAANRAGEDGRTRTASQIQAGVERKAAARAARAAEARTVGQAEARAANAAADSGGDGAADESAATTAQGREGTMNEASARRHGIGFSSGAGWQPSVFALGGADRGELAARLEVIADGAAGFSMGELRGLAGQLAAAAQAGGSAGPVRVAMAAATPDQLAERARQAARLLAAGAAEDGSGAETPVTEGPDVFVSAGRRGRVAVLFGGLARAGLAPAAGLAASLAGLRTLDLLGVTPVAAVGYGLGELAGLVWAGCLPAAEAARLAAQVGQVLRGYGDGPAAMARVAASEATAGELSAGDGLHIAAYEGPSSHLLAGSTAGIRNLTRRAAAAGVAVEVLDSAHALHSPEMAGCAAPLRSILAGTRFRPARCRLISTVTGRQVMPGDNVTELLAGQLSRPVLFAQAMTLAAEHADLIAVAGPDHGLVSLAAGCSTAPVAVIPDGPGQDGPAVRDPAGTARLVAALFAAGAISDVAALSRSAAAPTWTVPRMRDAEPECGHAADAGLGAGTRARQA